jgi:ferredoxin
VTDERQMHGLVERALKPSAVRRRIRAQPHQQVVTQGFAEQPWHLRCVGGPRRRHERCQVGIDVMSFALKEDSITNANSSCIGCGICVTVCPMDTLSFGAGTNFGTATKLVNITVGSK